MPVKVTTTEFDEIVLGADMPVLVDFYADWCGPCVAMNPLLAQLAEEMADDVIVVKVNVDEERELAQRYEVQGIPNMQLFTDGSSIETYVGSRSYDRLKTDVSARLAI